MSRLLLTKSEKWPLIILMVTTAVKPTKPLVLTEKEVKLIEFLRGLGYGQAVIQVMAMEPVRAEVVRQSVKF